MNELRQTAATYSARGWPVLPIVSGDKRPLVPGGVHAASTDLEMISHWWTRWPDANVGIQTGKKSGLFVLDVDRPDGELSLEKICGEHGDLPRTVEAVTGSGGRHLFFQYPGQRTPNRVGLRLGLDIRGDDGYVVAAPSRLRSGAYEWLRDPFHTEIQPAPAWLLSLAHSKCANTEGATKTLGDPRAYALKALANEVERVRNAPRGKRNDTLNRAACALSRFLPDGSLDRALVEGLLRDAALTAGLDTTEIRKTIESGLAVAGEQSRWLAAHPSVRCRLLLALPLSGRAKLLLTALDSHANSSGWAWPGRDTLRRECSFASEGTLAAALREVATLLERGRIASKFGRPLNRYRIRWDRVRELAKCSPERETRPQLVKGPAPSGEDKSGLTLNTNEGGGPLPPAPPHIPFTPLRMESPSLTDSVGKSGVFPTNSVGKSGRDKKDDRAQELSGQRSIEQQKQILRERGLL